MEFIKYYDISILYPPNSPYSVRLNESETSEHGKFSIAGGVQAHIGKRGEVFG